MGRIISTTGTLATSLGQANPFRYRGYYFDTETGLYYLQSRYYNPETCRMLNADDTSILLATQGELLGANLFAYCSNNPVMNSDPSGYYAVNKDLSYKGYVGWGIQVYISATVGCYTAGFGFELVWFFPKNNFGRGYRPWIYRFGGGGLQTLNIPLLLSACKTLNPKNILKALAGLSISVTITPYFAITAKSLSSQKSYEGPFINDSLTIYSVTASRARDPQNNITTYGIGATFSFGWSLKGWGFGLVYFGMSHTISKYVLTGW